MLSIIGVIMSKRVIVVTGISGSGKSTALRNMDNVVHLNCEEGKDILFTLKNKQFFKSTHITTPMQVIEYIQLAEDKPQVQTIVIDGLNYLMDMYESQFIYKSADTRSAWQDYGQFYKDLVHNIAVSSKDFIILAHVAYRYNEQNMAIEATIPVKGALAKAGLEASFTTIIGADIVKVEDLEKYSNPLLNITEDDKEDGFKYVLQTRKLANTKNTLIKVPMGVFARNEAFIDSDMSLVMQRLREYYV